MGFPWTAAAIAGAAGLQFGSNFFGGDKQGLSRDDQRFLADFQWRQSLRNEQFQNQLATHGIRMRAADAEAAGIHPLAALGMNPVGGSPVSLNFSAGGGGESPSRWGNAFSGLGQDISRAAMATATPEERAERAARVSSMEADTAESKVRKAVAEESLRQMRNPPMPQAYQLYGMPDGSKMMYYTPEFANAIQADPFQMYGRSWENVFTGQSRGGIPYGYSGIGSGTGPRRAPRYSPFYGRNK